ncbi:proline racemase family protein [Agromyces endophyticus]|uniref:proline racemase family protein n=1 Tax=Agromyces sp. H17E-10 TaxID=2932244 RepID=UPI001FD34D50|nr:proline racemase family protein [Agromyces sp. H17E-10]UOQ90523.1 proline racemase family protein [Agromyces sp. H17E-10]
MTTVFELDAVEVHAEGEPGRVITNAAALVEGTTMAERFDYCVANLDGLRRAILREPRGYPGLCAVFLLPPVNPESDFGIVVLEQGGFTPMSGSNTMCAVTAAIETGIVRSTGPVTEVTIDTAVGTVKAIAHVDDGKVTSVTIVNVPSFVVALDTPLQVEEFGEVRADIVYGGQFFAQVRAADLGLDLAPENGRALARAGALIKLAAQQQFDVVHPTNPSIDRVNLIMLHSGDRVPGEQARNTVVLTNGRLDADDPSTWTGALDRSPCGTGTSARMAALHARGQLAIGEEFSHRSIIGSEFIGALTGTTTVAGRPAVLPTVTGRAWITGRSTWILDSTDPFPAGYTVGDIWGPQP